MEGSWEFMELTDQTWEQKALSDPPKGKKLGIGKHCNIL